MTLLTKMFEEPTSIMSTDVNSNKQKKAYKELNLGEKVTLIRMAEEKPWMSQAHLAGIFDIAKSNVCRILKRKQEYLTAYESWQFSGERKRKIRECDTKELNEKVRAWYSDCLRKGEVISGSMVQEKARELARMLHIPNFVASNGWLQSFQKSYGPLIHNPLPSTSSPGNGYALPLSVCCC